MQRKAECSKSHLQFGELLSQGHYCTASVHVCVRVCVPAYVNISVCPPSKYNNAAIFSYTECSKTIKGLTEVLTVDYSGSKSKPGIMKPVCSTKLSVISNTYGWRAAYRKQHVALLLPDNISK